MSPQPEDKAARLRFERGRLFAGTSVAPTPSGLDWLAGLAIMASALLAYHGVWHAGFIWDDDGHVTRPDLQSLHGLWRIWFEPGATQQYYPLLHSAFWVEHRIWGDSASDYHVINVILHGGASFLLYRLLRRLALPGAFLAAMIFALHPVCVESVAWISEQKNTLSAVFCLAAALAYLRFDRDRRPGWYVLGIVLFGMALATKTVTSTLPAALLVVLWWKRGRLSWRGDVLPLVPWLAMGAAAGLVTAWVERAYIGASGAAFSLNPADRVLVAGRALIFYLGKVYWPVHLQFMYPRWDVDSRVAWQYLFPAAAVAAVALLYARRRAGRGPLAAALLFAGTLFPALGFFNVFPFVYSFVADHFQYMAAAVVIAATVAALAAPAERLSPRGRIGVRMGAACLVAALAWQTSRQCAAYADAETLWLTTIARNPASWMAYQNLGGVYLKANRAGEAEAQFRKAVAINPDDAEALNELGVALLQEGRVDRAVASFRRALQVAPAVTETYLNLGVALLQEGQVQEASDLFQKALDAEPGNVKALKNLGAADVRLGRVAEAAANFRKAAAIEPDNAATRVSLGSSLLRAGRAAEALPELQLAVRLDDGSPDAHFNLANALMESGRTGEAVPHFERALELNPKFGEAHNNLGNALLAMGDAAGAVEHFRKAIAADGSYADAHMNLGSTLLQLGRVDEAAAEFRRTIELRPEFSNAHDSLANALIEQDHTDEAVGELRAAIRLGPANAQAHNDLGAALARQGLTSEAVEEFGKAVELRPDYDAALVNLGNIFLQHGRAREAAGFYERALAVEPGDARVRNNLGIALVKSGRPKDAAEQFRKALEIEPGYAEARRNLSIVLRQTPEK